jgi:5-formyltetrahydrofolate cyclo-ligase
MLDKNILRKLASSKRSVVHKLKGSECSKVIANTLCDWIKKKYQTYNVGAYLPINTELDLSLTVKGLWSGSIAVSLPVVMSDDKPLVFKSWDSKSILIKGRFGVKVPQFGQTVKPDILLCPLLSYDLDGYRLGYGGGFYDRTIKQLKNSETTISIGCCYSEQLFDGKLPREKHDMPLDGIVTEEGLTFF